MIVVSDTSPLTALITIGGQELLPRLFSEVVIPIGVRDELLRAHSVLPDWLRVEAVGDSEEAARLMIDLDRGEAEAIELAKELHADRLLIDERKGRRVAVREGVPVIGLLGVLLLAKRRGLIVSARALLGRLELEAGIYLAADLKEEALRSVGE
jgi:predicted nucleic acid-binding protein